ncbi:dTDP-4-dehydrorhamnose reductase [Paenibacillus sp. J22TS3]|uniref:dTDP-4-dehydrorhamnose reductase n=1 Tax=Paenibacillus sp. J22TS3 TaxID=2807192 RepID=UPI001B163C3F|nr:dTDP-4-dehydrorhamnose reductase [Paenibacillus sp. J22TS3]GIP21694.1 NAD(P)-dependent oxidoreductase [Paenibacillus sp. J22TS3]
MNVLLVGGFGLLGTDVFNILTNKGHNVTRLRRSEMDLNNIASIREAVKKVNPDWVIHAAGYTNVELAEDEPLKAYNINSFSMYNLLKVLQERKPKLTFFSTDYVFDGVQTIPYHEGDMANPLNVYGMSKLLAEDILRANYEDYYIIRTSWLFGRWGKCFPRTIYNKLVSQSEAVYVVSDQIGCPTYTVDLANILTELLDCPFGTYHITNSGTTTWYDLAKLVAKEKKLNLNNVKSIISNGSPSRAVRPKYSVLDNSKWNHYHGPLKHFDEAIHEFLKFI